MRSLFLFLISPVIWALPNPYVPPTPVLRRQNGTRSACEEISRSSAMSMAADVFITPKVSAKLAYDCLTSVPLNKTDAIALIESILPYVQWQSDVSYLKNPPVGYLQSPVDISFNFNTILNNIKSGTYPNEHAFQADLYASFNSVHDGHFRFFPDLLTKALTFSRPISLVSVSKDGVMHPKIYEKNEILAYNTAGVNRTLPSELVKINGQDAVTFLKNWAQLGPLQDPDALYNNVFYEMAFDAQQYDGYAGYFGGSGRFGYIYPGPNTTLQFANETVLVVQNEATVIGDFTRIVDGKTFYNRFCTGPHTQRSDSNVTYPFPQPPPLPPTDLTPPFGYPTPVIVSGDTQVSGYFLDDKNDDAYGDIAVLSMLSFAPNFPVEFQSVVQTFIQKARQQGKTKLVIDLSGNGGGTILVGYDTFRQLFPSITQDGFSRFRQHEAFNILSEQISLYSTKFDATNDDAEHVFAYLSPPNYHYDLNETNQPFSSYVDKFPSRRFNNDNFTANMRWNLNDPLTTTNSSWGVGMSITGYGSRSNFTQPFKPMDIVLVYDGYCASTCSLFTSFMTHQAGVKTIAFGGRPETAPMQAVGGTKGANNYPYAYIRTLASVPLLSVPPSPSQNYSVLRAYTDLASNRSTDNSLNVRDQILRANLADGTPAQFIYEAADCRLWYEPAMVGDVTAIWRKAADVAWGGDKCVVGALGERKREEREERRRRSREVSEEARRDRWIPIEGKWMRSLNGKRASPEHGQKVPL